MVATIDHSKERFEDPGDLLWARTFTKVAVATNPRRAIEWSIECVRQLSVAVCPDDHVRLIELMEEAMLHLADDEVDPEEIWKVSDIIWCHSNPRTRCDYTGNALFGAIYRYKTGNISGCAHALANGLFHLTEPERNRTHFDTIASVFSRYFPELAS